MDDPTDIWDAWEKAGHYDSLCEGWTRDGRDGRVFCQCGDEIPLEVPA